VTGCFRAGSLISQLVLESPQTPSHSRHDQLAASLKVESVHDLLFVLRLKLSTVLDSGVYGDVMIEVSFPRPWGLLSYVERRM